MQLPQATFNRIIPGEISDAELLIQHSHVSTNIATYIKAASHNYSSSFIFHLHDLRPTTFPRDIYNIHLINTQQFKPVNHIDEETSFLSKYNKFGQPFNNTFIMPTED